MNTRQIAADLATAAMPSPSATTAAVWAVRAALGLGVLLPVLVHAWTLPMGGTAVTIGLCVYLAVLLAYPSIWLVVLPAAIPVFELGYWTGRLYVSDFDLLLAVTFAAVLLRWRLTLQGIGWTALTIVAILLIYNVYVTLSGLLPLVPGGLGMWHDQLSSLNSLREGKGYLSALLLLPVLLAERERGTDVGRLFALGMTLGLVAVGGTILWERYLFTGLANFADAYRVSGWFFGILTGGAAIDSYLILAAAFAGAPFLLRRRLSGLLATGALATLALYCLYVTYTRASYPAVIAMGAVLAYGWAMDSRLRFVLTRRNALIAGVVLAVALAAAYHLSIGSNIGDRFGQSSEDLETRLDHWSKAIGLVAPHSNARWVGAGRGTFPLAYYTDSILSEKPLAAPSLTQSEEKSFVTLRPGSDSGVTYLRQRFDPAGSGAFRLKIGLRAPHGQGERLLVEFCERHVLHFKAECLWVGIDVPVNLDRWEEYNTNVDLGALSQNRSRWLNRPVDISVMNRGVRERLDVTSVQLFRADGTQILRNTDFSKGLDHWFFSFGNHLRWHIKNLFLYVYFEGGAVGLAVLFLTLSVVGRRLFRSIRARQPMAVLLAAALVGTMFVGLFDSVVDDPRIAFLVTLMILLALVLPLASAKAPAPNPASSS